MFILLRAGFGVGAIFWIYGSAGRSRKKYLWAAPQHCYWNCTVCGLIIKKLGGGLPAKVFIETSKRRSHGGNTEEENKSYVVFKWNIHESAWKYDWGGGGMLLRQPPPPFHSRLLDRYVKTTWTVYPSPWIFASWEEPTLDVDKSGLQKQTKPPF